MRHVRELVGSRSRASPLSCQAASPGSDPTHPGVGRAHRASGTGRAPTCPPTPSLPLLLHAVHRTRTRAHDGAEGRRCGRMVGRMTSLPVSTTSRSYALGGSRLVIRFQDIVESDAEVLVSSDDYMLSMGGGVSAAIASAAGDSLLLDAAKSRPRSLGDVVVTTAGALSARYVFHGITIGQVGQRRPPADVVRTITRRCLQIAGSLDVSSIAFPALGTGAAGFYMEDSAVAMAEIVTELLSSAEYGMTVTICLHARDLTTPLDYIHFYEEFARRVPQVVQHETPTRVADLGLGPASGGSAHARKHVLDLVGLERRRNDLESKIDLALKRDDACQLQLLRREYVRNLDERLQVASSDPARSPRGYRVFISYAHEDERWWQELTQIRS